MAAITTNSNQLHTKTNKVNYIKDVITVNNRRNLKPNLYVFFYPSFIKFRLFFIHKLFLILNSIYIFLKIILYSILLLNYILL